MVAPLVLLVLSSLGLGLAIAQDGAAVTFWTGVSGLSTVASLILILAALLRRGMRLLPRRGRPKPARRPRKPAPPRPDLPRVIVDGSNVLFWDNEQPRLETVGRVVGALRQRGLDPGVIFDANVGYKIGTGYKDDAELARRLGLPEDRVLVVARGTPADPVILQAARDLGGRVVSNDRYRDWERDYPEVRQKGQVIRGHLDKGRLRLSL